MRKLSEYRSLLLNKSHQEVAHFTGYNSSWDLAYKIGNERCLVLQVQSVASLGPKVQCRVSGTHENTHALYFKPTLNPGFCPDEFIDLLLRYPGRRRPQLQPAT